MTTEDDFQAALDANTDDWQTRLVFADWLQERGDPRAEGYRAMGSLRVAPYLSGPRWHYLAGSLAAPGGRWLPYDWYYSTKEPYLDTRREADDAAALAFAKLPESRRAELLLKAEMLIQPVPG